MNPDDRVKAANRLGAQVTFDHPVAPRRDEFGAPWCPVCGYGLPDPEWRDNVKLVRAGQPDVHVAGMMIFTGACSDCTQKLDWSRWPRTLTAVERSWHRAHGCLPPNECHRCTGDRDVTVVKTE